MSVMAIVNLDNNVVSAGLGAWWTGDRATVALNSRVQGLRRLVCNGLGLRCCNRPPGGTRVAK
jgi:hypothetical protein